MGIKSNKRQVRELENLKLKKLKEQANKLPLQPGVYLMKNNKGEIIYVGKAKALKNRVTQYFGSNTNHTAKVIKMVSNVDSFETIICDTEYEALMLENSLIKQHQPKYNILLKDDKGYHYIKITAGKWPKIETVKNRLNDGAQYLGPYYSGYVIKETVDEVHKIFKLPDCNRDFDKPSKPCLNYHIGLCHAPCRGNVGVAEYNDTINNAIEYLKNGGISEKDLNVLKERMLLAADKLDFELAAKLRDRISAIEKSREKQKVIISTFDREDIFAIALAGELACVNVLIFRGGHLSDKKQFNLSGAVNKADYYSELLQQFYVSSDDIPPHIALDADFEELGLIEEWLTNKKGKKVTIVVPQKGTQKNLVDMSLSNAAEALSDKIERSGRETAAINELALLLGLTGVPRRIESYDISNTAGSENVGSMVVFIDGRPAKHLYRKFKIKSFIGQDDFRSLNEVLDRRFNEYLLGEDDSFKVLPDLILLDGGKGQISAVKPIFDKYKLNIPLFGMVKDSKHKTRAITAENKDIQIKGNRKAFTLVTNIQDEVHRVAIGYHKQRAKISSLQLELTKIEGVGPATAKKLIKHFKTISKLRGAREEDIIRLGISAKVAKNVVLFYSNY